MYSYLVSPTTNLAAMAEVDSILFIMNKNGFPDLYNYVNDLLYCGLPSKIQNSLTFSSDLLQQINPRNWLKHLHQLYASVFL